MKKAMISSSRPMDQWSCILESIADTPAAQGGPFDEKPSRRANMVFLRWTETDLSALLPTTEH
jgi:hypothetical protein